MLNKIWLSPPHMSGGEQKYIQEAFDSNWIAPIGTNIDEFEKKLQSYIDGSKEVVCLNAGTSAIHLALKLAQVNIGDEVICQSFTYVATANPILYLGATPVLIDSEDKTWNMCPDLLEKAIIERVSKGKKPKAIIVVDGYGMPFQKKEIVRISEQYNITLIEDAAAALGSNVDSKKCGSLSEYAIVSFNGNKIITTSGGGALICNNSIEKEKVIFWSTQARSKKPYFEHTEKGYNYRMSNVLAGIGRGQFEVLDERVKARRANFEFYKKELSEIQGISFLEEPEGYFSNRWLTCVLFDSFETRERIRLGLESENIESRPLWNPMHQQPLFEKYPSYLNGVSDDLFDRGLSLPSGSNLSKIDLIRIVNSIKELL